MVNDDASVEEALMWFQKTLGLDPSIAPAQCGAVNILNLLGRFDEATEAANGALGVIGEGTALPTKASLIRRRDVARRSQNDIRPRQCWASSLLTARNAQ